MDIRRDNDGTFGYFERERQAELDPLLEQQRHAEQQAKATLMSFNIVGRSAQIEHVRNSIDVQSQYDAPVLITGETGTGKELAARGLHYGGCRASQPFVPINCATLTDELFASEVFGHVKGAFTDAKQDKLGLLAAADRGTLFLDEVDSLSLKSQAALLRLLQEGEYRPVGSQRTLTCDVRLIASANCDLEERIRQGSFRQDLYYRLYILSVHMPPLRQRIGDIPLLVDHFLASFHSQYRLGRKHATAELIRQLQTRPWPGNVRELENMIHRLYLISRGDTISELELGRGGYDKRQDSIVSLPPVPQSSRDQLVRDQLTRDHPSRELPLREQLPREQLEFADDDARDLARAAAGDFDFSRDKREAVEAFEKRYVKRLLHHCGGNVTKAASLCGKERRAFGKLVKKYNIRKYVLL